MPDLRATFHRVTIKTKPPYLARVNGFGNRTKQPMLILVQSIVIDDRLGPPFGRAVILSSPSKYPDLTAGNTMTVNNFSALSRMQLASVPHSES